ncbi:MAG: DivIVA domain-containing protein [Clostridiales bacterium]|jgi:uncharacterized protein YutD|nr:DivIVA domain-containing protein [Clostridiales bacterium]
MPNKFNYVKRGYDPVEVDSYIETMETVIKSYKEKDASIKNAILNAQVAADGIILNAKYQSREIKESALRHVKEIKASVYLQKLMLKEFQEEYTGMLNKYMHIINNNDISAVRNKISVLEDYLDKFVEYQSPAAVPPVEKSEPKPEIGKVTSEEQEALFN